jgi:hypothetical protein
MSRDELDYVIDAVLFVAEHGWKFLHLYRYNHKTGEWAHTTRLTRFPERKWLSHFDISAENPGTTSSKQSTDDSSPVKRNLAEWGVSSASELFTRMKTLAAQELEKVEKALKPKPGRQKKPNTAVQAGGAGGGGMEAELTAFEDMRWFVLASEASGDGSTIDDDVLEGTKTITYRCWQ